MDGRDKHAEISSFFAKKYQDLYTSVLYDSNFMNDIFCELDDLLAVTGYNENCIIPSCNVLDAICKLNSGKGDGNGGLTIDNFREGGVDLAVHLSFLFSSLLTHGVVSDDMTLSTVIPIPKSKNCSQMDSSNFHGIALSSIYGKLFDIVILSRYSDCFMSSDL